MYIIDFDDTIFNTRGANGFKEVRIKVLENLGISKDLYKGTYLEARDAEPIGYNNLKHAQVLSKHGFDKDKILQALEKTTSPEILKTFLFDDTIGFLEKMKEFNKPMVLLSFGDAEFQTLKVVQAGLDKYVNQVMIVQEPKSIATAQLIKDQNPKDVWFINNRVDETLQVKEKIDNINYLLKKSEDIDLEEYKQSNLPYFETLTKIYEHIRTNQ